MAQEVIKRDGSRQLFDARKISNAIMAAGAETDLSDDKVNEAIERVTTVVSQMVEARDEITTTEIRERVLSELDAMAPAIAEAWRKYDKQQKEI